MESSRKRGEDDTIGMVKQSLLAVFRVIIFIYDFVIIDLSP